MIVKLSALCWSVALTGAVAGVFQAFLANWYWVAIQVVIVSANLVAGYHYFHLGQ